MKPIPVAFHIGPLEVHTYGIGLALTFWFAYVYFERRLKQRGFRVDWLPSVFIWIIITAVVGARALHVLSNLSFYRANPGDIFAIWHGGLSSFGGSSWRCRQRSCSPTGGAPSSACCGGSTSSPPYSWAAWAMGRLLGPQLMVAGGGHPTTQWFGMYYAGQAGRRLPVPIFQAMEDFFVYVVLILLERRIERWPDGRARSGYRPGRCSGSAWCCGASNGSWTSTSGSARTAISARSWSRWPASRWPWVAWSSWSSSRDVGGVAWRRRAGRPPRRGAPRRRRGGAARLGGRPGRDPAGVGGVDD